MSVQDYGEHLCELTNDWEVGNGLRGYEPECACVAVKQQRIADKNHGSGKKVYFAIEKLKIRNKSGITTHGWNKKQDEGRRRTEQYRLEKNK